MCCFHIIAAVKTLKRGVARVRNNSKQADHQRTGTISLCLTVRIRLTMASSVQSVQVDVLTQVFQGLKSKRDEARLEAAIKLRRYVTTPACRPIQQLTLRRLQQQLQR